jgi:hypothetical protein
MAFTFSNSWNIAHDQIITITFKLCDDKTSLILWLNEIIPLLEIQKDKTKIWKKSLVSLTRGIMYVI